MASAALHRLKQHHILHHHRDGSASPKKGDRGEDSQRQLDFVARWERMDKVLSPHEIAQDPRCKELGASSKSLKVRDFELVKTLGTGTFARVWLSKLAHHPDPKCKGNVYALKVLRKVDVIRLKQVEHVQSERTTLATVAGHPFITTLITTFSDHDHLYMLLDFCPGGEIFTYLRRATKFDEPTARFYAAEVVLVFDFLHTHGGIAYRDLKPENILLDTDGHLKLVDFGFAKKIGKSEFSAPGANPNVANGTRLNAFVAETYTLCGTPDYLAPEVIKNTGHGSAVDWWALGILIYEFLVGQPPFCDSNPVKVYSKILDGRISYPSTMSAPAKAIISELCTASVSSRLGHIAGGAQRIKDHQFFEGINWDELYYRRVQGPIVPKVRHAADASNFDYYEPPSDAKNSVYTKELEKEHENAFRDF